MSRELSEIVSSPLDWSITHSLSESGLGRIGHASRAGLPVAHRAFRDVQQIGTAIHAQTDRQPGLPEPPRFDREAGPGTGRQNFPFWGFYDPLGGLP